MITFLSVSDDFICDLRDSTLRLRVQAVTSQGSIVELVFSEDVFRQLVQVADVAMNDVGKFSGHELKSCGYLVPMKLSR